MTATAAERPQRIRLHTRTEGETHYAGSTQVPVLGQSTKDIDDAVQDFGRKVDKYLTDGGTVAPDTGDTFDDVHNTIDTTPNAYGRYPVVRHAKQPPQCEDIYVINDGGDTWLRG